MSSTQIFIYALKSVIVWRAPSSSRCFHNLPSCGLGKILLDTYEPGSLKAQGRELRGFTDGIYVITGPEQSPPKVSTDSLMKNGSFKNALGKFSLKEWQQSKYADVIGSRILYVSHGGNCVRIWVPKNTLTIEVPPTHQCIHAKADTLVALHASQIYGDIIVRASDTDIIVILLSMISLHQDQEEDIKYQRIVVDCGAGNSRRYIDVSSIHHAMEEKNPDICSALPAVYTCHNRLRFYCCQVYEG